MNAVTQQETSAVASVAPLVKSVKTDDPVAKLMTATDIAGIEVFANKLDERTAKKALVAISAGHEGDKLMYVVRVGAVLEAVKENKAVKHGEFEKYVSDTFGVSAQTGRNYRDVFGVVRDLHISLEKFQKAGYSNLLKLKVAGKLDDDAAASTWLRKVAGKSARDVQKMLDADKPKNDPPSVTPPATTGTKYEMGKPVDTASVTVKAQPQAFSVAANATADEVAAAIFAHRPDAGEIVAALQKLMAAK